MKIGFTCGAFDILHKGHIDLLKECKQHCDYLIVGLATDERIKEYKSISRPINSYNNRFAVLESIKYVDIVVMDTQGPIPYLTRTPINVYFKGKDWEGKLPHKEIVLTKERGIEVVFIEFNTDISTSKIIEKIKNIPL